MRCNQASHLASAAAAAAAEGMSSRLEALHVVRSLYGARTARWEQQPAGASGAAAGRVLSGWDSNCLRVQQTRGSSNQQTNFYHSTQGLGVGLLLVRLLP